MVYQAGSLTSRTEKWTAHPGYGRTRRRMELRTWAALAGAAFLAGCGARHDARAVRATSLAPEADTAREGASVDAGGWRVNALAKGRVCPRTTDARRFGRTTAAHC